MFTKLEKINTKPAPYGYYTAEELWTNSHTAQEMLKYHLNESVDAASRNKRFIDKSAEWIASYFSLDGTTSVIDFGCGPGLYATRLAERGARVTGIDFSKNSLDYAEKSAAEKNLDIEYINTNYLDFETAEKFDLIMMIMCDFTALSPEQRKRLLSLFRAILKPGGSVLLDVYSLRFFEQAEESASYELNQMNGFWSPDDYYGFVNIYKYDQEKLLLHKYTIIEAVRSREVYNWMQCFTPETLKEEFGQAGFEITELFSDVAGSAYTEDTAEFAAVARLR
jgi:cyclopropane fatty-acyl-phospholipid synthase-like methyltransferase